MMVVGDENSMDNSANLGWEFIYFLKNNSYPLFMQKGFLYVVEGLYLDLYCFLFFPL